MANDQKVATITDLAEVIRLLRKHEGESYYPGGLLEVAAERLEALQQERYNSIAGCEVRDDQLFEALDRADDAEASVIATVGALREIANDTLGGMKPVLYAQSMLDVFSHKSV